MVLTYRQAGRLGPGEFGVFSHGKQNATPLQVFKVPPRRVTPALSQHSLVSHYAWESPTFCSDTLFSGWYGLEGSRGKDGLRVMSRVIPWGTMGAGSTSLPGGGLN